MQVQQVFGQDIFEEDNSICRVQTSVSQYTALFFTNFLTPSYIIEFQPGIAMHIPDRGNAAVILAINESKLPILQADFTETDTIKQTKGFINLLFQISQAILKKKKDMYH